MIPSYPKSFSYALSIQIIILAIVSSCFGTTFNAKTQFIWVDSSCDAMIDKVNAAGDDYNALVAAAITNLEGGSPSTELGKGTLQAMFGTSVGQLINSKYGRLQSAFAAQPIPLGLYCGGTAFEWVTTYQEGPKQGQDLPNGGQWHAKEGRYNPAEGPLYLDGTKTPQRTSICQTPEGKNAQGVSSVGGKHIILCPDAFAEPVLGSFPTTEQPLGTSLDTLTSTGAVLLHEVTHCILRTIDTVGGYKIGGVLITAKFGASKSQANADTWMYYAMASLANKNAWVVGVAQATDNFGPKAPKAPSAGKRGTLPLRVPEPRALPPDDPTNLLAMPGSPILEARAQGSNTVTVTVTVTKDCPGVSAGGSTSGGSSSAGSTGQGSTGTGSTGAGSTGTGHTGSGSFGTGSTGTGTGSTGAGSTGTGSTDAGSTGAGSTGTGSTGTGHIGGGSSGSGSTVTGSTGTDTGSANSAPTGGSTSAHSGSKAQSALSGATGSNTNTVSNTNTASGFTTLKSNSGSSAAPAASSGYIGPVPISAEPASITAALASESSANVIGLTTYSSTTTPTPVVYSASVSSNGHTQKTNGVGPFPIFWSHTCWFCPPGLCFLCGISLDLPPGIYPPGSIDPPSGWTGPLPTITIGNDGTPSYDEDEPQETQNEPSNSANSKASSTPGPSSATKTGPASTSGSSVSSTASSGFNYIFETPAIYSEVSDTVPFSSISAVVASEFAANSINGDLGTTTGSTTGVASSSTNNNNNSQPASTSFSSKQPSVTPFSSKQPSVTPTTSSKPSSITQTFVSYVAPAFTCTSSMKNPDVSGYPCLCQGLNYCSQSGGGCGWTTVPAAEDCCLDCM